LKKSVVWSASSIHLQSVLLAVLSSYLEYPFPSPVPVAPVTASLQFLHLRHYGVFVSVLAFT
jgi:hypothetical protein